MDATLIECILKRDGGTKIDLGNTTYHFAPDSEGRHVAMVADPDHIGRLLSISEGYRIPRAHTSATAQVAVSGAVGAVGAVAPAVQSDQRVIVEPVKLDEDKTDAGAGEDGAQKVEDTPPASDPAAIDLTTLDRDKLAEIYLAKVGQKAHPAMSAAKMIEKIKAASAA